MAVESRLEPPTVTLQNYAGDELDLIRQIKLLIGREDHKVDVIIKVQNNAPLGLLIGTDILSRLGIVLMKTDGEVATDVLQECQ